MIRNKSEQTKLFEALLKPPPGWTVSSQFERLDLSPSERGEIFLKGEAPLTGDDIRRLVTVEIKIDGRLAGEIGEALVTVRKYALKSDRL
jgi:hypothetical protein